MISLLVGEGLLLLSFIYKYFSKLSTVRLAMGNLNIYMGILSMIFVAIAEFYLTVDSDFII